MNEEQQEFLAIMAYVQLRHGKAEPAAPLLEALQCLRPDDRCTARSLAYAYLLCGRYSECLKITKKMIDDPDDETIHLIHRRATYGLQNKSEKSR